ncbi:hypothetical protein [Natronorubrum daqingense]|uniref:Uncharacterized protein n=1 Tax=Natronorubrum daqingense TaxID=588898 RepID=A0A1N7E504_9EURY|nr:hypothetical protein [Natronorubrum daqingense]APX96364.1 hypothetical protein BB347_06885 [Natronorubrum daqingense]SIR83163.1 hypothetical protein SAMN05421809_2462 [Natronorubrum daqingense]
MRSAEKQFTAHLADGESVQDLTSGSVLETPLRGGATVGVTDRRILCVSNAGEYIAIPFEYICSIHSNRRTKTQYRSDGERSHRTPLLGGLAVLSAVSIGLTLAFALDVNQILATIALAVGTVAITAGVQRVRGRSRVDRSYESVLVGAGILALAALVGVAVFVTSVFTPLYALVTVGGLALVAYAARHSDRIEPPRLERRHETFLTINTVDGETVRIVVDANTDLARTLSTSVYRTERGPAVGQSIPTPSD